MERPEVTMKADLEGLEQMVSGFHEMGERAEAMNKVAKATTYLNDIYNENALTAMKTLMSDTIRLTNVFHSMAAFSGVLFSDFSMIIAHLGSLLIQITSFTVLEYMRAGAEAAKWGLLLPLIAAGGAFVYATIVEPALALIPSREVGGSIYETGPYLLHAGEYVLPRGATPTSKSVYIAPGTINIDAKGLTPAETANRVVKALRDVGAI